jgi:hypothetical protein
MHWERNGFRKGTVFRAIYESHVTTIDAAREADDEAQNKAGAKALNQGILRKKNGYNLKIVWEFT